MKDGRHPLEHLSLDTIDYMAARLGLDGDDGAVMYDPAARAHLRQRVAGHLGAVGLREAVAEVIAFEASRSTVGQRGGGVFVTALREYSIRALPGITRMHLGEWSNGSSPTVPNTGRQAAAPWEER